MTTSPRGTARAELARRQQGAAAARRRAAVLAGIAGLLAALILTLAVVHAVRHETSRPATLPEETGRTDVVEPGDLIGLQTTPAPWAPEDAYLQLRLTTLRLPPVGDSAYQIHAHLGVFVDGKRIPVPSNIGVSELSGLLAPLHTHDSSGVVYVEAVEASSDFTLGTFFDLWGVWFTDDQLGAYRDNGSRAVDVYVNGRPVDRGRQYLLQDHDDIVVTFGVQGSNPNSDPHVWREDE